jgi:hypothetical protein
MKVRRHNNWQFIQETQIVFCAAHWCVPFSNGDGRNCLAQQREHSLHCSFCAKCMCLNYSIFYRLLLRETAASPRPWTWLNCTSLHRFQPLFCIPELIFNYCLCVPTLFLHKFCREHLLRRGQCSNYIGIRSIVGFPFDCRGWEQQPRPWFANLISPAYWLPNLEKSLQIEAFRKCEIPAVSGAAGIAFF